MKEINTSNYESFFLDYIEGNLNSGEKQMVEEFLEAHPNLREELESFEMLELKQPDEVDMPTWNSLKRETPESEAINQEKREKLFFQSIEGTLSPDDERELEKLLEIEANKKEFELWKMTILAPEDLSIDAGVSYRDGLDNSVNKENYEYFLAAYSEGILSEQQVEKLKAYVSDDEDKKKDLDLYSRLRLETPRGIFYPNKSELKKSERAAPVIWLYRAAAIAAAILLGIVLWNIPPVEETGNSELAKTESPSPKIIPNDTLEAVPNPINSQDSSATNEVELEEAPILEWEIREPDPLELAQEMPQEEPIERLTAPGENIAHEPIEIKVEPIDLEENLAEVDSINSAISDPATSLDLEEDQIAYQVGTAKKPEFQTIGDLAENALANRLELSDAERDEIALTMAKRFTKKASEVLDTEVKKEEMNEGENLTYTLRVGSFKVQHSKRK